jgi:hypothetical protein
MIDASTRFVRRELRARPDCPSSHPAAITFYVYPVQAFGKRTTGNNGCSGMLLDRRPCVPNNALAAMPGEE